jgi:hypothetical protein
MMIHNGSQGAIPDPVTFPTASVCLDCGFSTFTLTQNELMELKEASVKGDPKNAS